MHLYNLNCNNKFTSFLEMQETGNAGLCRLQGARLWTPPSKLLFLLLRFREESLLLFTGMVLIEPSKPVVNHYNSESLKGSQNCQMQEIPLHPFYWKHQSLTSVRAKTKWVCPFCGQTIKPRGKSGLSTRDFNDLPFLNSRNFT